MGTAVGVVAGAGVAAAAAAAAVALASGAAASPVSGVAAASGVALVSGVGEGGRLEIGHRLAFFVVQVRRCDADPASRRLLLDDVLVDQVVERLIGQSAFLLVDVLGNVGPAAELIWPGCRARAPRVGFRRAAETP